VIRVFFVDEEFIGETAVPGFGTGLQSPEIKIVSQIVSNQILVTKIENCMSCPVPEKRSS
jgi:hypothetical protein